jgi:hypothetical protein
LEIFPDYENSVALTIFVDLPVCSGKEKRDLKGTKAYISAEDISGKAGST